MKFCKECLEPIPEERLKLVPDTEYCKDCQEVLGDVLRYKGIREKVGTKHLGGCEGNILRDQRQIKKFYEWSGRQKNTYPSGK